MKKLNSLIAALVLAGSLGSYAQTVDEVVQKHLAAMGGEDNWKKVTSLVCTGNLSAGGSQIPVTVITVNGKGQRVEFTFGGMTGYQILTPTAGWTMSPMNGQTKPEAAPDELVKESQDELDISGPLVNYKAKGNKVTLLGKDNIEGSDCYKLKVVLASGKEETLYIDATTYYLVRTTEKQKAGGQERDQTTNYSNYTKLPEGIVFAMSVDDGEGPVTFDKVVVNSNVDEKIFKPTEGK